MGEKHKPAKSEAAAPAKPVSPARVSKKDQIVTLYQAGVTDVGDLATLTRSRPSYVASVLSEEEGLSSYFDLYTSTSKLMNAYSKFFAGKLGFRDEKTALESLKVIDVFYRQFALSGDRAGQHHTLLIALTMFDRARWTGKQAEAEVFRQWLSDKINETSAVVTTPSPP